jgi:predicted TIM-barrel fold metal-dependent hydrolase
MPEGAEVALCDRYAVADVDSHIIEPADLWTSRVSSKWGDLVPHVAYDERHDEDRWYIGSKKLFGVGAFAQAGWREFPPSHPKRLSEAIPAAIDPKARLAYMDEVGVYYQLLYPNILGFHSHVFLNSMDHALALECVQAYNDWLTEFCSADSRRLIPMMMLPFWDVDASVAEMKRAYDMGHKGVLFAARYDKVNLPRLVDDHWEPLLAQAQEMGLSMNFHVGFLAAEEDLKGAVDQSKKMDFTRESSLVLLGNAAGIAEVILSGVCHRYPDLNFVSVENGAGWLPFLSESMDWQWLNVGAHKDYRHRPAGRQPDVRDRLPTRDEPLPRPRVRVAESARRHANLARGHIGRDRGQGAPAHGDSALSPRSAVAELNARSRDASGREGALNDRLLRRRHSLEFGHEGDLDFLEPRSIGLPPSLPAS